jgi:outer membrane protein assembly factor BamB
MSWEYPMRVLVIFFLAVGFVSADNWHRFRGPEGRGHTTASIPTTWSEADVKWRVDLPGVGQSCPINWGDKLFVTSAENDGKTRLVICLNRETGKVLWKQAIDCANPEALHGMNTWATPTCVTDGERVVAFFGPGGLHCFDMDGKKLWSKDLGTFPGDWGVAASPIILGDQVIQNADARGPSFMAAFDKTTGKEIWRTKREDKPRGGWSTPILIDTGKRQELLLNGEFGVRGYDPKSGSELWFCKAFNGRGSPVPEFANGLVITVNGKPGDAYAVKPGGSGDVTSTMAWRAKRKGGRDLPAPIVVNDYLFITSMSGIASMYEAKTGKVLWVERLSGKFSASPIATKDHVYVHNEAGTTYVIKPGPKLDIVATNSIGDRDEEIFRAAVAPVGKQIFMRSSTALYCVGK